MKIVPRMVEEWPKLAWVATFQQGSRGIQVWHGPMVETSDHWLAEAVWAGDFAQGGFDLTDLVFGTGIRCRGDRVTFVSSGTAVDRLVYCARDGQWYISNSLPALLASAGLVLCDDYPFYTRDLVTIETRGIKQYTRHIPAKPTDIHLIYFDNLTYDGQGLNETEKADTSPRFTCFADYYGFLADVARRLGENLASPMRHHAVLPLVAISSGYDSPAVAVISRLAGCSRAATITQATSLWRGSDSGAKIAERLGLSCSSYDHRVTSYTNEVSIWAAFGRAGGLNLTLFDYPRPLCLSFNGSFGDKLWDREYHDLSEPVGDTDSPLGEFRLFHGLFHCVVPWWGIRHAQEIHAIGSLEEMAPWTLHTAYDRPIARRIIEEAGVPRGAFAVRKKNTSSNTPLLWPYSPEMKARFAEYLRIRGIRVPSDWWIWLTRRISVVDNLVYRNVTKRLGFDIGLRDRLRHPGSSLIFQWANAELKRHYEEGLKAAGASPPIRPS
ncbi:MAG TPA: hypothetical protein VNA25_05465 [Phycisphaerae bacterium]|nr:hypothetical protein [Phycisphaerae bacterium]